jgi:aminoglycoside phosphotransferase (APT) family kinase protein
MRMSPKQAASTGADGDAALASGLAQWLTLHRDLTGVAVTELTRPVAGYSSETVFADLTWDDDQGPHPDRLVVRLAPRGAGTFADYDLRPQWQAQIAVSFAGVPVADPVLETNTVWVGEPFIVMSRVDGHIIGPLAHRDTWLSSLTTANRAQIHDGFLAMLAAVHRADPDRAPAVSRRDNGDELRYWDEFLSWSTHGHPVPTLVEALAWCARHRPDEEPPGALLWGDVRFENTVFDDDLSLLAVLDWDMTTVGAPEHDLAWFTSLDVTQHRLFGERADGFPDRDATVARFEELSGRHVRDLAWYETLAMVRSAAVMTRISILRRDAGRSPMLPIDDNPILDLLRSRLT